MKEERDRFSPALLRAADGKYSLAEVPDFGSCFRHEKVLESQFQWGGWGW